MIDCNEKISFLKSLALCDGMKEDKIAELSENCHLKEFNKKNTVFLEQDSGTVFYLIYSGRVKITKINQEGNEVILAILGKGDFFGEMSIIDDKPRNANAFTIDKVQLLAISRSEFLNVISSNSVFSFNLLKTFAARLRMTDRLVKSLFLDDARRRVLYTLFNLAEQLGERRDEKTLIINKMPNQTDLGNLSGTSRETLSRLMKEFDQTGIIRKEDKSTLVLDYEKFKERMLDND